MPPRCCRKACPLDAAALARAPVEIHLPPERAGRHHRRPDRHPARRRPLHGRRQCRQRGARRGASARAGRRASTAPSSRSTASSWPSRDPRPGPRCRAPASRPANSLFMHGFEPRPGLVHEPLRLHRRGRFRDRPAGSRRARRCSTTLLADDRVMWIGLAARDSLRLEAGLCLHGQDITDRDRPGRRRADVGDSQGRCAPAGSFVGAEALHAVDRRAARPKSASA